jgi:hypothetical protein
MAFSPQQHTSLLRDGLDFVPESDFRYLPINVRLKLVELEKTNGQVYLPKNEAASLKREVAAEKMSEVAKRNDPDAYFGGDPEYSSTPITDDPAELKGRLGTDEYGTRPTIYRAIEPEGAVFNNRYLTSGQYESQYKESDPTIYGRYTPTKKGDEILLPPTASWLNPFADRINETEPHEYMHRGMMPTNWLSKYLLGPIDSISEKVGVGNLFGTRVFAGNQHTYIAKALAEDKQKKQIADFERQTSKLSERELAILKKYLASERNKLQLEKNRIKKATGGVVDDDLPDVQPVQNNYVANPAAEEYYKKLAKRDRYFRENIMTIKDPEARDRKFAEYADFSVFRDILPFIPINVKQHAYHMAGGKGDVDINDLTKKEQEAYYRYAQEIMASGELPLDQDSSVMMDYPNYGTESDYGDIYWGKKNLGLSDEQLEAWKKGEIYINYPGGRNGAVESYSYEEFLEKYPGALDSDGQSIGDLITNMQDPNYVAKTFTGKADINYNKDSNTITVTDNYNHNRHPDATNKDIIEAFIADPSLYAALKAGALLKNADGSVIELDLGSPEFVQSYPTGYAKIRFRASKFNLKEPDKIADEIFNNIEYLKNDFENHLEEINPNLTKYTRIKKATGGEANNLQAAIDLLNNPVTSSISPLGDPTLSPLMESLQKNPIDDFAMMMVNPVKKVTSAARLAQLANPTNEVFKTATKKEIVDYIQTIPLKERLALRANDSIPLKGKYAILDSDKIDFYKDIVDLGKLPKNFKAGDNTLAKIYMEKNNIPSRVDITEPLAGFKPRPYFEEIIDFKKGTEKIKLSFPKTGVLQPYGAQTAYRTKTLTNPSKEQLDKLFKGMREKDLQKQLDGLRKAKSIESDPGSTLGDLAEATKLKQNASFKTSDDIAKELLELQGEGLLDTDLLAILRKQYNL